MFADDVSDIALWTAPAEDELEDRLPIPDDLRQRIKAWVHEYTADSSPGLGWTMETWSVTICLVTR